MKRKISERDCPICGKTYRARGLHSHMAHVHNIREVVERVVHSGNIVNKSEPEAVELHSKDIVESQLVSTVVEMTFHERIMKKYKESLTSEQEMEMKMKRDTERIRREMGWKRMCEEMGSGIYDKWKYPL